MGACPGRRPAPSCRQPGPATGAAHAASHRHRRDYVTFVFTCLAQWVQASELHFGRLHYIATSIRRVSASPTSRPRCAARHWRLPARRIRSAGRRPLSVGPGVLAVRRFPAHLTRCTATATARQPAATAPAALAASASAVAPSPITSAAAVAATTPRHERASASDFAANWLRHFLPSLSTRTLNQALTTCVPPWCGPW